jgi:hypothetical protein
MPRIPTDAGFPVDDADTWNIDAPVPGLEPESPPVRRRPGLLAAVLVVVILFVIGLGAALSTPFWWPESEPAQVAVVPAPPSWRPSPGPLIEGAALDGPTPSAMRWSPDGGTLGWAILDPALGRRVVRTLPVGEDFGPVSLTDPEPEWVRGPRAPTPAVAEVEQGLVVVQDPQGHDVGFLDLRDLVGATRPTAPAVATWQQRIRLAVVATPIPARGTPATEDSPPARVYVFDITELVLPPEPPRPTRPGG